MHLNRAWLAIGSLLMCGVAIAFPAVLTATTVIAPTFDELVSKADVIFEGEVIDTRARVVADDAGAVIVTDVYFRVDRVLKGTAGSSMTLTFAGGTVGDRTFTIDGMPVFAMGDRDVLFAMSSQRLLSPLVAMMHGRVRIVTDRSTKDQSVRRFDGRPLREAPAVTFSQAQGLLSPTPSMSLTAFEDAVRSEASRVKERVQ